MDRRSPSQAVRRQAGISLIEIMVGLVIGMIATAVIFQTFAVSEGFKRNTTSAGDAQQNGLFSTFTMALELANAGNGLATAGIDLANCPSPADDPKIDVTNILRPIPVFITANKNDNEPDSFIVNYAVSPRLVFPATADNSPNKGDTYHVQSPGGFANNDMIVAVEPKHCERTKITNIAPDLPVWPDPASMGWVTITSKNLDAGGSGPAKAFTTPPVLFNMGPWDRAQRVQYDVADVGGGPCTAASSNCVLRSLDLNAQSIDPKVTPVPLASNIVNMKVQFGVDTKKTGVVDTWVTGADAGYTPDDLMKGTIQEINRVKAVRIGFVVRSAQYERDLVNMMPKGAFNWVMFDCETHDAKCPGRLTGTVGPDANGGGYRYRIYETVVPLRNQLWNKQL